MEEQEQLTVIQLVDWDITDQMFDQNNPEQSSKMSLLHMNDSSAFGNNPTIVSSSEASKQKVLISNNKTTISLDDKEASSFHKGLLSHLTAPKVAKGISILKDVTKSSPSSPTSLNEREFACQRQRSYSDSEEKLSAQDKACLEEIERGSQLTLEDQELFEDLGSHKKFGFDSSFIPAIPDQNCEINGGMVKVINYSTVKQEPCSDNKARNLSNESVPTTFIDNIDLNHVDPLESALLQSSIPVSLSKKLKGSTQLSTTVNSTNILIKRENVKTETASESKTVIKKKNISENQSKITSDSVQNPSYTLTNEELSNVALSLPDTALRNAAAPTIKQVVVHFNGNKQVFDVPDFNGEQLTVQPIGIFPPSTEGPVNVILPQNSTLQNGLMMVPVEKKTQKGTQPITQTGQASSSAAGSSSREGDPVEKSCVCEECGMAYSKPSKLKLHIMSKHTGHRPYRCSYPGCDWAFTAKYKLQRHEDCHEKKKNGIKEYQCPIPSCGRKFSTTYNVATHMKIHERPLTEECEVCKEKFGTQKDLDRHMRTHGDKCRNVKCPVEGCEKMFYSRVRMGSHLQSHQRQTSFTCTFEGCDKVFQQKCKLINHMRHHTNEKPFKCTFMNCSWRFSTSSHLRRHLKSHTNERNYPCDKCDKKFLRLDHLKGHMVSHTGEKPFICEVPGCKGRFTAKSTMYMHMKKHKHMDQACMCPIEGCQKVFKSRPYLKKHLDQHYGTECNMLDQQGAAKSDSESSGLQFINVNLTNDTGNINQILQVSPELAQSLLAASAGSMVETHAVLESEANQPITIPVSSDSDVSPASDTSGGSARTDYQRNHQLSTKAKKRRMILKQKAAQAGLDLISVQDIHNTSKMVSVGLEGEDNAAGPVMNPNEVMTSRAITIRDPETGATYVQTQLLQDDPPNLEFADVGLDDGSSSEFGELFNDQNLSESIDLNGSAEFTVSTINLHDLVGVNNT